MFRDGRFLGGSLKSSYIKRLIAHEKNPYGTWVEHYPAFDVTRVNHPSRHLQSYVAQTTSTPAETKVIAPISRLATTRKAVFKRFSAVRARNKSKRQVQQEAQRQQAITDARREAESADFWNDYDDHEPGEQPEEQPLGDDAQWGFEFNAADLQRQLQAQRQHKNRGELEDSIETARALNERKEKQAELHKREQQKAAEKLGKLQERVKKEVLRYNKFVQQNQNVLDFDLRELAKRKGIRKEQKLQMQQSLKKAHVDRINDARMKTPVLWQGNKLIEHPFKHFKVASGYGIKPSRRNNI